jgi:putative tryptophan/tyrosine transport system substrate-binding protein
MCSPQVEDRILPEAVLCTTAFWATRLPLDVLFTNGSDKLAALMLRHALPEIYSVREFAAAGGLISYGPSIAETWRLAGIYTDRILYGEKPADLPVQQVSKVELVINLKAAKALGLAVPANLLALVDEVIE